MRARIVETSLPFRRTLGGALLIVCVAFVLGASGLARDEPAELYAQTFDVHWEALRDNYPYFELYGVDWEAERAEHRPHAVVAANPDEFAWELARLISALPDPHVAFIPAIETLMGRWGIPDVETKTIERRTFVLEWPESETQQVPPALVADPHAYPEIVEVQGQTAVGSAEILAAGPLGTTFDVRLRWPDGSETDHAWHRPQESNVPPPKKHYGEHWLVTGRVGSIGYMHIKTFNPKSGTMGADGKMTTMLRAALRELSDTDALILDFQGNGGGVVAASDPFLGHFLERRLSYAWGNGGGKRVIRPGSPRYRGKIVALVDERSASGGEWAPRILRDAGRAKVVGGRTQGAEAAVDTSTGPDGSVVHYSSWPMVEPGRKPFQEEGIVLDHPLNLTIEDVRTRGYEEALDRIRRARMAKALELLGGPANDLEAFMELADSSEEIEEVVTSTR